MKKLFTVYVDRIESQTVTVAAENMAEASRIAVEKAERNPQNFGLVSTDAVDCEENPIAPPMEMEIMEWADNVVREWWWKDAKFVMTKASMDHCKNRLEIMQKVGNPIPELANWRDLWEAVLRRRETVRANYRTLMIFTHDHTDDTQIHFSVDADGAHLRLYFDNEDTNCGQEQLETNSSGPETLKSLSKDTLDEISEYLDCKVSADKKKSSDICFDDYTKSALYAWESALNRIVEI